MFEFVFLFASILNVQFCILFSCVTTHRREAQRVYNFLCASFALFIKKASKTQHTPLWFCVWGISYCIYFSSLCVLFYDVVHSRYTQDAIYVARSFSWKANENKVQAPPQKKLFCCRRGRRLLNKQRPLWKMYYIIVMLWCPSTAWWMCLHIFPRPLKSNRAFLPPV